MPASASQATVPPARSAGTPWASAPGSVTKRPTTITHDSTDSGPIIRAERDAHSVVAAHARARPDIFMPVTTLLASGPESQLVRRVRLLAWGGNAWHLVEFAIAVGAGIAAGSVALVAFGADSLIEGFAGLIIVWRFSGSRRDSAAAERRAQQLIAVSFLLLVVYIAVVATRTLIAADRPGVSWVGIGLAAFTAATMPLLAGAKRRAGRRLNSAATVSEAA